MPGRWRADASPWVKAVMDDFSINTVHDIAVQCAARSVSTQTVMNCACWAKGHYPADVSPAGSRRIRAGVDGRDVVFLVMIATISATADHNE